MSREEGVCEVLQFLLDGYSLFDHPLLVGQLLQESSLEVLPDTGRSVSAPPPVQDGKETIARPGTKAGCLQLYCTVNSCIDTWINIIWGWSAYYRLYTHINQFSLYSYENLCSINTKNSRYCVRTYNLCWSVAPPPVGGASSCLNERPLGVNLPTDVGYTLERTVAHSPIVVIENNMNVNWMYTRAKNFGWTKFHHAKLGLH